MVDEKVQPENLSSIHTQLRRRTQKPRQTPQREKALILITLAWRLAVEKHSGTPKSLNKTPLGSSGALLLKAVASLQEHGFSTVLDPSVGEHAAAPAEGSTAATQV